MPCYVNGRIVPGDRASCMATPFTEWRDDASLMTDPDVLQEQMQANIGALTETQDIEQQGLDAFNTRDYINKTGRWVGPGPVFDAQQAQDYTNRMGRWVGKGPDFQAQGERWDNTDDFGRPLTQAQADTNFAGITNWEMARDRAAALQEANLFTDRTPKVNADYYKNIFTPKPGEVSPYSGRTLGESYDLAKKTIREEGGPLGKFVVGGYELLVEPSEDMGNLLNTIADPELRQEAIKYINENPATATMTGLGIYLGTKSKRVRNLWNKVKKRYTKKKTLPVRDSKTGRMMKNPKADGKGKSITGDIAKTYLATNLASKVAEEQGANLFGQVPTDKTVAPKVTDDDLLRKPKVDPNADVRKGRQGPLTEQDLFDPKGTTGTGTTTGTTSDWLSAVKGGAGDWDTKLYRLGELMTYLGTPLSKRGAAPTKRWQGLTEKALEQQAKLAMKGLELKSKQKGYQWKAKEIADYASNYFDSYFGIDFPFGKDKEIERNRFITAVADTKRIPGNENVPLQDIIDEVLEKGNFR